MIDIIIPAYNAHKTIETTLHSIAMQVNKDDLQVIIVNDGGKDYKDIINKFTQWLNIKEVACPSNIGPGYARNYGIDNSNSEYIMFMDADDTLAFSYSLLLLYNILKNSGAYIVTSKVLEVEATYDEYEYTMIELEPNMMWLFGHMYRRDFIDKYNIRFATTCHNEDVGFNSTCAIFAVYEKGYQGIAAYSGGPATYEWRWNKSSITRKDRENIYNDELRILGYIYNNFKVYKNVLNYSIPKDQVAGPILRVLFSIYRNHHLMTSQEYVLTKQIEDLSRLFFYEYYNIVKEYISFEHFQKEYEDFIADELEPEEKERVLQISFEEFVDFMFSEPVDEEIDFAEIESILFTSKED